MELPKVQTVYELVMKIKTKKKKKEKKVKFIGIFLKVGRNYKFIGQQSESLSFLI